MRLIKLYATMIKKCFIVVLPTMFVGTAIQTFHVNDQLSIYQRMSRDDDQPTTLQFKRKSAIEAKEIYGIEAEAKTRANSPRKALVGHDWDTSSSPREDHQDHRWWWKDYDYVHELARAWKSRNSSWCIPATTPTPSTLSHGQQAKGMIFVKSHKASSSTGEGVAMNIAHHIAKRNNFSNPCLTYTKHEFSNQNHHARRNFEKSIMWSFVRNPAKRDLSQVFHFDISRQNKFASNNTKAIINSIERNFKGRQTRYLTPDAAKWLNSKAWPHNLLQRGEHAHLARELHQRLLENYDFLGSTDRMEESLAVMVLLWGLDPSDVIVLSSKRSGGYDARCFEITKAVRTPDLDNYFETQHLIENVDYVLFDIVNQSLDLTIRSLGSGRVHLTVERIRYLLQVAEDHCLSKAIFPCSPDGKLQRGVAKLHIRSLR